MSSKFNIKYLANGTKKETNALENEDFKLSFSNKDGIITLDLEPNTELQFEKLELILDQEYSNSNRIFTNGYQSWTVSREYTPTSSMEEFKPTMLGIQKHKVNPLGIWGAGDLLFHKYPTENGVFYGYSYGYIREQNNITLFGSLDESTGYTIITFNTREKIVSIEKELQGVTITEPRPLLKLAIITDEYDNAFDKYFELMGVSVPRVKRSCGYTTWYNYYTNVTADIVSRDLEAISKLDTKIDIFQIDDGYESTVGDWLIVDEKKFPNGMKAVADDIHSHNMLAGLWLAPFAATKKSTIFKEHKDWLVRNTDGKLRYTSQNWGGFYTLDIYNPEVREYIKGVFDTVLNEWGYDMVKLDFLYACCLIPIHNKSRGQIMCEAMDFLRECCGDKIILGCGVPLAPAFGKVDFCRIGADVALSWDKQPFSREDVSTQNTLTNTIFRRHLDGRAWLNDPDVFLLRDNNIEMPMEQRKIIALINSLFGNLLFVSDDVSTYTDEQKRVFIETITREHANVLSADLDHNYDFTIKCVDNNMVRTIKFNLKTGVMRV